MTATVERIKKEINTLEPEELDSLLRDLQSTYALSLPEDNMGGAEDAWDAEIALRVEEVEAGLVELISGEESERRIDALFSKHGLQRRTA